MAAGAQLVADGVPVRAGAPAAVDDCRRSAIWSDDSGARLDSIAFGRRATRGGGRGRRSVSTVPIPGRVAIVQQVTSFDLVSALPQPPGTDQDPTRPSAPGSLPDDAEALDAYSRVVTWVAERLAPSVANLRVSRRGRAAGAAARRGDHARRLPADLRARRRRRGARVRASFTDGSEVRLRGRRRATRCPTSRCCAPTRRASRRPSSVTRDPARRPARRRDRQPARLRGLGHRRRRVRARAHLPDARGRDEPRHRRRHPDRRRAQPRQLRRRAGRRAGRGDRDQHRRRRRRPRPGGPDQRDHALDRRAR